MLNPRAAAAAPFACMAGLAIVASGCVAAAIAYSATQPLVWMVAYLVLVVGVMQAVFGVGQAWLAARVPGRVTTWGEWILFNAGSAGVIAGTLCANTVVVAIATLVFAGSIAWFLIGVRRCRFHRWGIAYRVLLALIFTSACIGLVISALSHGYV